MAKSDRDQEQGSACSRWRLRLAGGQEDGNPSLWSPQARSRGAAGLASLMARCSWLMLAVFVAALAPAAAWVLSLKPPYEVALRLFVKPEPAAEESPRPVTPTELMTEVETIRSAESLRSAAEKCDLSRWISEGSTEEKLELAVRTLDQDLRVAPIPDSSVISIEYSHEDPEAAAQVVKTLAGMYLEQRAKQRPDPRETGRREARRSSEEALREAQAALQEFQKRNQAALLEIRNQAGSRSTQLEAESASIENQIKDAAERVGLLEAQAAALPANVAPRSGGEINEPLIQQLTALLGVLEKQRAEVLRGHDPTNPLVRESDRRIASARVALARVQNNVLVDETEAVSPLRRSIEADYQRAQTELARLDARRTQLADSKRTAAGRDWRLRQVAARLAELERAVQAAGEKYLVSRRESEEEAESADTRDGKRPLQASVLEPAAPPARPADRRQALLLALSLMVAAGAAFGAAVLYDPRVKPTAYVAEIATAAGAPVLVMMEETE